MRLRARYDPEDVRLLALVAALLLFIAFLTSVGPFWFPIGVGKRVR